MNNRIEFWLSFNNGAEKIRLPVNPPTLEMKTPFSNTDIEVAQLGEFTVIGERGLAEFSFHSFFPSRYNASYCEYSGFLSPNEFVAIIERWRDTRRPIRFLVTGTQINYAVTIREFEREIERAGAAGDIYYTLALKEYRFLKTKVEETTKPAEKQRPPVVNDGSAGPANKSYTIKKGDNLSKIAKEVYGNANDWRKIYEANKDVIGANPNLIYPDKKLVIP
ncbi:LysM peptidoglycan-binding domain-containing protein [Bacillus chungangensis]|uniref:Nucleoid-associated protein YgaU n=1 Tax=Bacillus chungangensis TaxID=587633 RepID=A0ABT9WMC3_9BACI|nr:LysM peptidoglycan-binding domain-containing protein [Bacillus chungangensis]MDQ0174374.1 nucleoid-associated protein YgaU [Bacillus chungangensis]